MWDLFMSSAMKAAIHFGPNYTENLEVYQNTHLEEIQSKIRDQSEVDTGPF